MLRIVIAVPFLFLLVLFALSNPQPVTLGLWPTDFSVEVPLSLAVLGAMGVAFLAGALLLWVSVLVARRRAARAERAVRLLEAQVSELKARLSPPHASTSALALPEPAVPVR